MEWMLLPLKRYADFSGRSRRMEYWMFALMNFVIAMVLMGPFVFSMIGAAADPMTVDADPFAAVGTLGTIGLGIYGLYALAIIVPSIAVVVRRLHDRDMSGWWYLGVMVASLIPLVGLIASIAFLVLMFLPGTPGPNRFGPDPKSDEAETFA
ncbi:DUF805 domain-containing protein [Qipengyuania sp. ASV99]|uniref:DUF805 domain-containing protein n=1 Tax=Qipengyuania sp. ASV99 TaxID=3399681 RepID=UPI003A4C6ECF